MDTEKERIISYYRNFESRLGYSFLLWDTKHFGYYPSCKGDISERKAQVYYMEKVAETLQLEKGMKLLDAGCGRGVVACYLAQHYEVHVTGIDIVDFELEKARRRARQFSLVGKTDFQLKDYSHTDFPNDSFDKIYTTETLSHAHDVRGVLKEFYRLLKPGGKIVLFEYTIAEDNEFTREEMASLDFVINGSGMFGLKQFRHGKFPQALVDVGFINVKEMDITDHIGPSFLRLNSTIKPFYWLIKILGLRKYMINSVASAEFLPLGLKGLIRYSIFTGKK